MKSRDYTIIVSLWTVMDNVGVFPDIAFLNLCDKLTLIIMKFA